MNDAGHSVDLGCAASVADPAGYFAAARERAGAVQWSEVHRAWVVISHTEVSAAFRDPSRLSADRASVFARASARHGPDFAMVAELLSGWMNFRDDPAHQRLREPVGAAFAPRTVAGLDAVVQSAVDRAIGAFARHRPVELSAAFAGPIPAMVIATLLGAEPDDHVRFQAWSDDLARIVFSLAPGAVVAEPVVRATRSFVEFFGGLVERERAEPTGSVLTAIVNSEVGQLSTMELIGACTMLLFAGHETTASLIDQTLAILLERPELAERLRTDPALWETAIDEMLRVVGPARTMARKVAVDHERAGHALHRGETLFVSIAAANHDDAVFERPGELDLARQPNPHLGFGWGPHFCLGASLARLEARLAVRTLLERFPGMAPAAPVPPLRGATMGFEPRPLRVDLG